MSATRTIELPRLYPAQHAAIFAPERYAIVEASTKAGKTAGCLVWQAHRALSEPGEHWWVAPVYPQARIAYRRVKRMLPKWAYRAVDTDMELHLATGSRWRFRSGEKPDNLYGEDVRSAVIDEASRLREDAWHAIRSTLTHTRGPVRIIGNVRGRRNWAWHLARRAEAGEPDWHYARLTVYDAVAGGVVDVSEIEDARRVLPEHVFRELYLAEGSDDGSNPFGLDAIADCVGPLSLHPVRAWGWDLARKLDWVAGVGLDGAGGVVELQRWHRRPWHETEAKILASTKAFGFVDASGVGDPVTESLQRSGAPVEGVVWTAPVKQSLMERLAHVIQHRQIMIPDGPMRAELEAYEYVYTRTGVTYGAPSGYHDDCVAGLALAVAALDRVGWGAPAGFAVSFVDMPAAPGRRSRGAVR